MPFTIRTTAQNKSFLANKDESILDAGLRQNFDLPHSCGEGSCGSCKGQVIDGLIDYDGKTPSALTADEITKGCALFCIAKAKSDLLIDVPGMLPPPKRPAKLFHYRLENLSLLSPEIYQAILLPTGDAIEYLAGQYVELHLPSEESKPFSIANAPRANHALMLNIRCQNDNLYAHTLIQALKKEGGLNLSGPFGRCYFHESPAMPMILLAVGTGFSPMKAILEEAFQQALKHEITLFWAGKTPEDFYELDLLKAWEEKHANFRCVRILSSKERIPYWDGIYGNIFDAVIDYFPNLAQHHIYFGGPMQLTLDGIDQLSQHGAKTCFMYSDAFDFI